MRITIGKGIYDDESERWMRVSERNALYIHDRGCVSMDTRGAMAPTIFEKDAFGTHDGAHEILKSLYNGTHVHLFLAG